MGGQNRESFKEPWVTCFPGGRGLCPLGVGGWNREPTEGGTGGHAKLCYPQEIEWLFVCLGLLHSWDEIAGLGLEERKKR